MKCKNCKHYRPCNKYNEDMEPIESRFERCGECKCEKHIVGDPKDYGLERFNASPYKGGLLASNGWRDYKTYTEFYVDKNFGCRNFKRRK